MARIIYGPRAPSLSRDIDGHREYKLIYLVELDNTLEGPATALNLPGLPRPGDRWEFGNELDLWAWCKADAQVTPETPNEPCLQYQIEFTFTTKPYRQCQDTPIENPLLIPDDLSVIFNTYTEEVNRDRFGTPLKNSAHELLKGPQIEFDKTRVTVRITRNVPYLNIETLTTMNDTVNSTTLWGMPPRTIKFNFKGAEKKYYGQCLSYYSIHMEFEIRYEGFDRNTGDVGTKVLQGEWKNEGSKRIWKLVKVAGNDPDPTNPNHFMQFKDPQGNTGTVVLNGAGLPAEVFIGTFGYFFAINDDVTGIALTDNSNWLQARNFNPFLTFPSEWEDPVGLDRGGREPYAIGELVSFTNDQLPVRAPIFEQPLRTTEFFINLKEDHRVPPKARNPAGELFYNRTYWRQLPGDEVVAGPFSLKDKGDFDNTKTYNKGDFVKDQTKTYAGNLHIEYYEETEFRRLGLPEIL